MVFEFDRFRLDDRRLVLSGPDGDVHVEPQVFGVLRHLLVHRDRVVRKEEILDELWGDRFVSESALTSRVKAARQAIGDDGRSQRLIGTIHGVGYRFVGDVVVVDDDPGDGGTAAATLGPAPGVPLPALRTALIGRGDIVRAVSASITQARLTTLIGPGGVGKTTVALAVAHGAGERGDGGPAFADLVPARTADDVIAVVAQAVGVEGDAARSGPELARHLADRSLLVMDNCEHVIDAAAALVHDLLAAGGGQHVLATSREPLGLADEHLVPIEPLGDEAAELFVARARQSEPRVEWDPGDETIVAICERLDGLPLALELAAGQLRRWSLSELDRRLRSDAADVAARPGRRALRHQTMTDAIGWSYGLLDRREQQLLRTLGVFPSHFDLDAVRSLRPLALGPDRPAGPNDAGDQAAATGPVDHPGVVDDILASLVDKSLVVRVPAASTYRLLETIRTFALEQLDECGERDAAFERHRTWVVGRATATSRMDRWASGRLAARQRDGADDARQAFWASLELGRSDDAVELAVARSFLWRNAVGCAEGHRWLAALATHELPDGLAAWVPLLRADIALGDGEFVAMIAAAHEASAEADERDVDVRALALQFRALEHLLDADHGVGPLAEVVALAPDERLANLARVFAVVAHLRDPRRADLDERIATLRRGCSDDGYERFILNWTAWMYGLVLRDTGRAEQAIGDQYDYLRHIGLPETWLTSFSLALTQMIDGVSGRQQLAAALQIADREGYRIEGDCMLALAYTEVCRGEPEVAAELLGLARTCRFNATAHHVLHGIVVEPVVRQELDDETFRIALARGRQRDVDATLAAYGIKPGPPPP